MKRDNPEEPCRQCPFRRTSGPGWLGASTPEGFIACILGEIALPCHPSLDYEDPKWQQKWELGEVGVLCTGALLLAANMSKRPRDCSLPRLDMDKTTVFVTPQEFIEHHRSSEVYSWDEERDGIAVDHVRLQLGMLPLKPGVVMSKKSSKKPKPADTTKKPTDIARELFEVYNIATMPPMSKEDAIEVGEGLCASIEIAVEAMREEMAEERDSED